MSRVHTARNVEQLALFRATLSRKRDVVQGVTANFIPGYSTMQTLKSYQMKLLPDLKVGIVTSGTNCTFVSHNYADPGVRTWHNVIFKKQSLGLLVTIEGRARHKLYRKLISKPHHGPFHSLFSCGGECTFSASGNSVCPVLVHRPKFANFC